MTQNKQPQLAIYDCHIIKYEQMLELQLEIVKKRQANQIASDTIFICEHSPVITLGARQSSNILLSDESSLKEKNIDLVRVRRGGGATAHNPGQLVIYPIIALKQMALSAGEYVKCLEQIGIELLSTISITAKRKPGFPGLWAGGKKIASVGVRISKFITYHGIAINIQNDLDIFSHIVPCGLNGIETTSAKQLTSKTYDMKNLKKTLCPILAKHFNSGIKITLKDIKLLKCSQN